MTDFLGILRNMVIIAGVGGVGWYLWWLFTRPTKITYKARIYQLGGASRTYFSRRGDKELKFRLQDLKEFKIDTVERVMVNKKIVHRLVGLKIPVPEIESDMIENWNGEKWVNILIRNEQATILRRGFDLQGKQEIFDPLPVDETNMIMQQAQDRKDRTQIEKGLLQAILPWVGVGIMALALVGSAFFMVSGMKDMKKMDDEAVKYHADKMKEASDNYLAAAKLLEVSGGGKVIQKQDVGVQKKKEVIPSVE